MTPRVSLSEIFTDNVNLQPAGETTKALVTRFRPGVDVSGRGARFQADLSYRLLGQLAWPIGNVSNEGVGSGRYRDRLFHQLNATGTAELMKRHVFIDGLARRRQFATTLAGPLGIDTTAGFTNLTAVTVVSASPYLRNHFGPYADSTLRYSYDHIFIDRASVADSQTNQFSETLQSGDAFGPLLWSLNASRTRTQRSKGFGSGGFSSGTGTASSAGLGRFGAGTFNEASATLGYRLTRHFSVSATGGYQHNDYKSFRNTVSGPFWTVGFSWVPNRRTSLSASYGKRYFGNTGSLNLRYRGRMTLWQASYRQSITSLRSTILTNAGTVSIFSLNCPPSDPTCQPIDQITVLRPEAVQAFMLLRRGRASVTLNGAKHSATLAYAFLRRTIESNGLESRQQGVNLNWTWRLKTNVRLISSGGLRQIEPLRINGKSNLWFIRTGLTRDLGQYTQASLTYRHQARITSGGLTGYDENAFIATVSTRY